MHTTGKIEKVYSLRILVIDRVGKKRMRIASQVHVPVVKQALDYTAKVFVLSCASWLKHARDVRGVLSLLDDNVTVSCHRTLAWGGVHVWVTNPHKSIPACGIHLQVTRQLTDGSTQASSERGQPQSDWVKLALHWHSPHTQRPCDGPT